jgi:copper(I)-binding protein
MTRAPRRRGPALALVFLLLAAGCTYYPSVREIGGVRLRPEKGRIVRSANEAVLYFDLESSGMYGDVLKGAEAPFARQAAIVGPDGARLASVEIPGATTVKFDPEGRRVVFSDLTHPILPGEVYVVTLAFDKSGLMGVVSVVE